ncbi:MAG: hypothetical protein KatS3mg132_188 [Limisphaera sp.]|nr:MAG: hypothetical protein KatS3mg132_188 [Limisphaera sp.]
MSGSWAGKPAGTPHEPESKRPQESRRPSGRETNLQLHGVANAAGCGARSPQPRRAAGSWLDHRSDSPEGCTAVPHPGRWCHPSGHCFDPTIPPGIRQCGPCRPPVTAPGRKGCSPPNSPAPPHDRHSAPHGVAPTSTSTGPAHTCTAKRPRSHPALPPPKAGASEGRPAKNLWISQPGFGRAYRPCPRAAGRDNSTRPACSIWRRPFPPRP